MNPSLWRQHILPFTALPMTAVILKGVSVGVHELTPNPSLGKRGAFQSERHFLTIPSARALHGGMGRLLFRPLPFPREGGRGDEFVAKPNAGVTFDDNGMPSHQ